jgi:uncharacterized protein YndB with AHSA1/START domain
MHEDDYGVLEQVDDRVSLRFIRRLRQPPLTVWRALTEPDDLAAWFPTTIDGDRRAGARLRFSHRDNAAPPFDGEMLAYEPTSLIELRWGEEILRFELEPDGAGGTVLTFTDTFAEVGKAARDGAGWHACLDLLALVAGGKSAPWSPGERWRQLIGDYRERLGAEASTIGPPTGR